MIFDNFKAALGSLWANKLRSFLTLLGIFIGIYAVVTLLSIARGVQNQTTQAIDEFGPTLLMVMPGEDAGGGFNIASSFAPSTLFVSDVELLRERADLVEKDSVGYIVYTGGVLKNGEKKLSGFPYGASPAAFPYLSLDKVSGREMTEQDILNKTRTVFLTEKGAEALGVEVGDKVTLGVDELSVEGIFRVKENAKLDPTASDSIVIPASLAQELNKSEQVNQIIMKGSDIDKVDDAKEQVTALLKDAHGGIADFTIYQPSDLLDQFNEITDILTYMVVGIASISLLVGGIGISNIMLVTVTERTREIGIRKAVGATEGAILTQFLVESVILTVIGAIIAIGFAALTGMLVEAVSPLKPILGSETILLALGMAALTGIVFGLFPAFRAARKNPVDALRFE
jgi:putative ABC transport system permease protein